MFIESICAFSPRHLCLSISRHTQASLRHLNLEFEADYGDVDEPEIIEARHVELGRALRSVAGLETLRLVFDEPIVKPEDVRDYHLLNIPVVWERVTEGMTWSKLRSLEIHVATYSEVGIKSCLGRHAVTLRSVKLVNMWLTDCVAGWESVFKAMKNSLKLEEVRLQVYGVKTDLGDNTS